MEVDPTGGLPLGRTKNPRASVDCVSRNLDRRPAAVSGTRPLDGCGAAGPALLGRVLSNTWRRFGFCQRSIETSVSADHRVEMRGCRMVSEHPRQPSAIDEVPGLRGIEGARSSQVAQAHWVFKCADFGQMQSESGR